MLVLVNNIENPHFDKLRLILIIKKLESLEPDRHVMATACSNTCLEKEG